MTKYLLIVYALLLSCSCNDSINNRNSEKPTEPANKIKIVEESTVDTKDPKLDNIKASKKSQVLKSLISSSPWRAHYVPDYYTDFYISGDKIRFEKEDVNGKKFITQCDLIMNDDDYRLADDRYYLHAKNCTGDDADAFNNQSIDITVELEAGQLKSWRFNQVEMDRRSY
jgi:hypothetical protein